MEKVSLSRQLVFAGGFQRKSFKLETTVVATDNGVETFVMLRKQEEWLLKAVAGKGGRPGALTRTKIFGALKAQLRAAVAAVGSHTSDSQGSDAVGPDPADPMTALAPIAPLPKKPQTYA